MFLQCGIWLVSTLFLICFSVTAYMFGCVAAWAPSRDLVIIVPHLQFPLANGNILLDIWLLLTAFPP